MSERERFEAWAMSCKCPPELLAMGADYGGKGLLAGQWAAWQAALARSGQAASGSSQGARSDDQSGAGQPEAPTAAPLDPAALVAECAPYLKEGETPLQRIQRDSKDMEALLTLLSREKLRSMDLAEKLAARSGAGSEEGQR